MGTEQGTAREGSKERLGTWAQDDPLKARTRGSCSEFLHSSSALFFPVSLEKQSVVLRHMGLS